jgi:hypothetical protein
VVVRETGARPILQLSVGLFKDCRKGRAVDDMTKGILYYTCNCHRADIEQACRAQLTAARDGHGLVSVSQQPIAFGDVQIVLPNIGRSPMSMHKQILAGLEQMTMDVVFLCESDVLYHPSHFDFVPPRADTFYYNVNVWRVRYADGHAVRTAECRQVSGCCADRVLMTEHYRKRLARILKEGRFDPSIGYEPGAHGYPRGIDNSRTESWSSKFPNLDIRHDKNLTRSKWAPEEFRNQKYAQGWEETDGLIEGWNMTSVEITAQIKGEMCPT